MDTLDGLERVTQQGEILGGKASMANKKVIIRMQMKFGLFTHRNMRLLR